MLIEIKSPKDNKFYVYKSGIKVGELIYSGGYCLKRNCKVDLTLDDLLEIAYYIKSM